MATIGSCFPAHPKAGEVKSTARLNFESGSKAEWLAKYAPELNDIERSWQTLKAQRLAHKTFRDPDHLETTIHEELAAMNANQSCHPLANQRISA